ncbi:MAG: fructose-bisphosphate aldolase, partial [Bacteroidota bacterium]
MTYAQIAALLGPEAEHLLNHHCKTFPKDQLQAPSPNFVEDVFLSSNRSPQVLKSLAHLFGH